MNLEDVRLKKNKRLFSAHFPHYSLCWAPCACPASPLRLSSAHLPTTFVGNPALVQRPHCACSAPPLRAHLPYTFVGNNAHVQPPHCACSAPHGACSVHRPTIPFLETLCMFSADCRKEHIEAPTSFQQRISKDWGEAVPSCSANARGSQSPASDCTPDQG